MRLLALLPLILLGGCLMPHNQLVAGTVLQKQIFVSTGTNGDSNGGNAICGGALPGNREPCDAVQEDQVTIYKRKTYVLVVQGVTRNGQSKTGNITVSKNLFHAAAIGDAYHCSSGKNCTVTKPH